MSLPIELAPAAFAASAPPAADKLPANPAPPNPPRPADKPCIGSPVIAVAAAPVTKPACIAVKPIPAGPRAAPATNGSKVFRLNASSSPVSGFLVKSVPAAFARAFSPATSPEDMWTNLSSPYLPFCANCSIT